MAHSNKGITRIIIATLFVATILLALVPVFQIAIRGGYQGVPPGFVDDDLQYYARMKEVADGKPFIGNPDFIEYRDARPITLFAADWLAAIPLIIHIPFSLAIVLNFIFWSLLFVGIAYSLGRVVDIPLWYSACMSLLAYGEVYWLVFRPSVMQEVFPFFLMFMLAVLLWLRQPLQKRTAVFLVLMGAISFYVYTYSWQISVTVLGTIFLYLAMKRRLPEIRMLMKVVVSIGLLASPAIIYLVREIYTPFYWESMARVGLVQSHLPTMDAYHYGRWVVLLCVLALCMQKWLGQKDGRGGTAGSSVLMILCSGVGMLIMSASNIITGKDLATAIHIGRYITLWFALFFPFFFWKVWTLRGEARKLSWWKLAILGMLLLAGIAFLGSNLQRSLPFRSLARADTTEVQGYAAPLNWLDQYEQEPVVIWADDELSMYVPILTKHYVLWNILGKLNVMPTEEVEDRFLISRIGMLTSEEIVSEYGAFEGAGALLRHDDVVNKNRISSLLKGEYRPPQDLRTWIGTEKINTLLRRQQELKKNILTNLKKFQVAYIIADIAKNEGAYFKSLPGTHEVWKNTRFIIYEIRQR